MSTHIRADLDIDRSSFGIAVSAFFLAGAILMPISGHIIDRIGPRLAYRTSAVVAAGGLLLVAVAARSAMGLALALAVAGSAAAVGAPAASTLIVRLVPLAGQAKAFAVERAAIPFATLAAGLFVPTVAVVLPWRWVFGLTALLALSIVLVRVPDVAPVTRARPVLGTVHLRSRRPLLLAATSFALMSTAVSALGTFLVDFSVTRGQSPGVAGVTLAVGSLAAIAARLGLGWHPPRSHTMRWVAGLMFLGGAGFVLLVAPGAWTIVVGVVIAYAAGWGWTGMMVAAVLSTYAGTPGSATGILQSGGAIGGIVGPVIVGAAADAWSYEYAWFIAASFAVLAALMLIVEPATRRGTW